MKRSHHTLVLTLLITLSITILPVPHAYSGQTTVNINPKQTYSYIGQFFTINVSATDVTELNAWQLYLLYDPAMLNCTGLWVPPDNIFAPYGIEMFAYTIDNTTGFIRAFCALNGIFGVNGSGTLCQIQFECKNLGITSLCMADKSQAPNGTYLQDPSYNLIPFNAIDGVIEVGGPSFQENVFNATQNSETYYVIIFSNSTVTSFNYDQSLKMMSFDASGQDGTTGLSFVEFSKDLLNGTLAVLMEGRAIYPTFSEDQTNNFLSFAYSHSTKHVKILLTIIGDVNGDRTVNMLDIFTVIYAYMTPPGNPKWNPLADVNRDNTVNMVDIEIEIQNFLKKWVP
jgi:hypothetical protein